MPAKNLRQTLRIPVSHKLEGIPPMYARQAGRGQNVRTPPVSNSEMEVIMDSCLLCFHGFAGTTPRKSYLLCLTSFQTPPLPPFFAGGMQACQEAVLHCGRHAGADHHGQAQGGMHAWILNERDLLLTLLEVVVVLLCGGPEA
eukprot:1140339-Pelagomonas_calceolata.AAC.4